MLTVKEVAGQLGISPSLVYALCARGLLVHERYGLGRGTVRISEQAIEDYRTRRDRDVRLLRRRSRRRRFSNN